MLEVAGENRDKVRDTQTWYTYAGTVNTSTRETEVPGDTGEGRSRAVLDPATDSLWTAWKFGLYEKACAS